MTLDELKGKMLHQLLGFVPKENRSAVTQDTVLKSVLGSELDGLSPATVFKQHVQLDCKLAGVKLKRWPEGWVEKTIAELAPKLLPDA